MVKSLRVKPDGRGSETVIGSGAGGFSGTFGAGVGTGYFGTSIFGSGVIFGSGFGGLGVGTGYFGFSASYPSVIPVFFYLRGSG